MKKRNWKEIAVTEIEGFSIGNAEYEGTGCTVILMNPAATAGVDIRGGGPASREAALLNPLAANDAVNAVLLSGGSAYGLAAADGVMKYLEERNIGFPTDYGVVPIVCASCLFDLPVGDRSIRPDAALGYQACMNAGNFREGNHGAGTGASCGKLGGISMAMKSGLGGYAVQIGALKVGAVVAANPLGNITDPDDGTILAGMHDEAFRFLDEEDLIIERAEAEYAYAYHHANTTLAAVMTNAAFTKTELTKIAGMAHNGYSRAIRPVHTMFDGDSIYALSSGTVKADLTVVGVLASLIISRAIVSAAAHAESAFGLPGLASI